MRFSQRQGGELRLTGSFLGARFAIKGGDRVVNPVMLTVVLALVGKLAFDLFA